MFKLLGQLLALVAIMASALNAQCAVSCSLITPALSSEPRSINAGQSDADQSQHACCPHQSAPNPKQPRHNVPCPPPLPAASKDRAEQTNASSDSLGTTFELDFSHQCGPLAANGFIDHVAPAEPPTLKRRSSISILRV